MNDKKRVEQELHEKSVLETELAAMQNELRNAEDLLLDAYSINIIPKQYRDIYAAFYLYDYLSTSAASLETALLHYNLEELKARLNEVIRQQSEMLLEMAIQSAHLADIRTNTENAAARRIYRAKYSLGGTIRTDCREQCRSKCLD